MPRKLRSRRGRDETLSRECIIEASIELLDSSGEEGLTFRTLSERLATGPGALYWHIANKGDLLTAACDLVIAHTLEQTANEAAPIASVRAIALGVFEAIDAHPWIGTALTSAPESSPFVRILERIGQQIRALGVPQDEEWAAVGALMAYVLDVSRQNAMNGQQARTRGLDRSDFLEAVATAWSELDANAYPFTSSVAGQMRDHDDKTDFLAGIDFILRGIDPSQHSRRS